MWENLMALLFILAAIALVAGIVLLVSHFMGHAEASTVWIIGAIFVVLFVLFIVSASKDEKAKRTYMESLPILECRAIMQRIERRKKKNDEKVSDPGQIDGGYVFEIVFELERGVIRAILVPKLIYELATIGDAGLLLYKKDSKGVYHFADFKRERQNTADDAVTETTCTGCGAKVVWDKFSGQTTCEYCGDARPD